MAKLIGQAGSITISATVYPVGEWSINITNDVQDVTDTGTGGWIARLAGLDSGELTFRAFWGSAAAALSTAFAIGSTVSASLALGNSSAVVTGNFIISTFTITNNAKTPIEFQCTAQSTGTITLP